MVHQIIHMEQFRFDSPLVVVVRARSRGTHSKDGSRQQFAEVQDILTKAFEVIRPESEAADANFEEFLRCGQSQRPHVQPLPVIPIQLSAMA